MRVTAVTPAAPRVLLSGLGGQILAGGWLLLVAAACALRVATSPLSGPPAPATLLAYLLIAAAPVATMAMALRMFRSGDGSTPANHLDRARYDAVPLSQARRHPDYGPGGVMVSLLAGLLLSILLRAGEYLAAMPALSGPVPPWLATLHLALTIDAVLFTSLYAAAFAAALRKSPLFPPLLAAIWAADLIMQVGIGQAVAARPDLPAAVGIALGHLLQGNAMKVLISVTLWMPYLLLSTRVNVTYRHRLPR